MWEPNSADMAKWGLAHLGREEAVARTRVELLESLRAELEEASLLQSQPVGEQVALWNEQPLERRLQRARWFLRGTGRWPGDENVVDARFGYVEVGVMVTFDVNLTVTAE
jgi:hypothetical protein